MPAEYRRTLQDTDQIYASRGADIDTDAKQLLNMCTELLEDSSAVRICISNQGLLRTYDKSLL